MNKHDKEKIERLQYRAEHLRKRIAVAKEMGRDLSYDKAELSAITWVLERVGALHGTWPASDLQRAFVEGMKWWQFKNGGATAFPSEVDEAEAEAERRYHKEKP